MRRNDPEPTSSRIATPRETTSSTAPGAGAKRSSRSRPPSGRRTPDAKAYHRNIRIEGNTFRHFDYAVLFARSVEGLEFSRNRLERTRTFEPFYRPYNLFLDGCRKVRIEHNSFGPDFPGHNIGIEHMRPSEIVQRGSQPLEIICK